MSNEFNIFLLDNPCRKYMFLELSPFSYIPTFIYQLIVKGMCAIMFIDAYYSCGPSSHSIAEWLGETNSSTSSISKIGSKQLYSADQNASPAFALFYRLVSPSFLSRMPLMNSWCSDTSHHHHSFLGPRVVVTRMPKSELWCVKSILRATRCLVVKGQ